VDSVNTTLSVTGRRQFTVVDKTKIETVPFKTNIKTMKTKQCLKTYHYEYIAHGLSTGTNFNDLE